MTVIAGRARLIFDCLVVVVFATALMMAGDYQATARWFPHAVALAGTVFGVVHLAFDTVRFLRGNDITGEGGIEAGLREQATDDLPADGPEPESGEAMQPAGSEHGAAYLWAVLLSFVVLVFLLGMLIATLLWLFTFLVVHARWHVLRAAIAAAAVVTGIVLLNEYLNMYVPQSLFFDLYVSFRPFG